MSSRFYDPAPTFFNTLGTEPVAGGQLVFYLIGTTTPKGTWSDPDLTIPNTNPVQLDSSGRAGVNIWLDGAYRVVLLDSLGATVWDRDVNSGDGAGATIPALLTGQFLTNDGSTLQWSDVRQVPDPTGSGGKILGTDGSNLLWQAPAAAPSLPVTTDNSVKINNILDQWGTGSIPASGSKVATTTINFPVPYIDTPNVQVMINRSSGVVAAGFIGCLGCSASTTQLTVYWDLNIVNTGSQYNLTSPIPISWRAIGKVDS